MKIKTVLDVHEYAPEMNKLHFHGVAFRCPRVKTIKEAKQYCFPKKRKGLYCRIDSIYSGEKYKSLNRIGLASGKIENRISAVRYAKQKLQQNGGILLSGEILPPNKLKFKFYY